MKEGFDLLSIRYGFRALNFEFAGGGGRLKVLLLNESGIIKAALLGLGDRLSLTYVLLRHALNIIFLITI